MSKSRKIVVERDLVITIVLTLIIVLVVSISSSTWLRTIFGIPFILFLPGYSLTAALFPRKEGLCGIEHLALSFGLSVAVTPLIVLILNYAWNIKLYPILLSLSFFILAMSIIAGYRRRSHPPDDCFFVSFPNRKNLPNFNWHGAGKLDKVLPFILVISILSAIMALAYIIATPKDGEQFTEFYIMGLTGRAENYPEELTVGEEGKMLLVVANHEYETVSYRMKAWIDDAQVNVLLDAVELSEIEIGPLAHEEKWEHEIGVTPQNEGDYQKIEFRLFKDEDSEPYLILHLYVDVSPAY